MSWDGDAVTDSTRERESVGDSVALYRDVTDVGNELGYEIQVIELPR
jgi:hypothetical protein